MPNWALLHMRNPLNTTDGTGQWGELTKASSRKFTFGADDADTLSFDMPGNHRETGALEPLVSDILAFRDEQPAQRFRVVSRVLTKDAGVLKASFSAVSYKALPDAWILHDTDTRSWTTPVEQTALAWSIFNEGQTKAGGFLGVARGVSPSSPVMRTLTGSVPEGGTRPEYFMPGMARGEAIDNVAAMINGFEWDIQPSPADPYRRLVFNTWNMGDRNQHEVRSPLVLDDGGSMSSWSHTVTPTDYANVIRHTGAETTTSENAPEPILPAWFPAARDPVLPAPEGRWERDINNSDLTTQEAVTARAPTVYDEAHLYVRELTCTLRRGRWQGPRQLWVGDQARVIITEPVLDGDGGYIAYIDEDVRVVELSVDVDDLGAEDVSLSLNRARLSTHNNNRRTNDRLRRLERR